MRLDDSLGVALRTDATSDFGPATTWFATSPDGGPASLDDRGDGPRVALAPAGDEAVVIGASGVDFLVFERRADGQPWDPVAPVEFGQITYAVAQDGATVREPVLGAGSFFYVVVPSSGAPSIVESTWNTQSRAWNVGVPLPNPEFAGQDASTLRRPTGVSADGETLFFFDEVAGIERAAWRSSPAAPFDTFEDLPAVPEAAPNADCNVLYFQSTSDAGNPGLGVAR
jgi:hypothetical protein